MEKVQLIDLQFLGSTHTIASYLMDTGEGLTLIETGPHSTYARLVEGLGELGYHPGDVRHVFLTHIHLDHAGAAWALAKNGARIYVHPTGTPHLIDPSRLMHSAGRIYGDQMDYLWGRMEPIPEGQIHEVQHEEVFHIGTIALKAWHTPGHAVHHIAWQYEDALFTGDVAGVKIDHGIVVPPCPPPDINLEDWRASPDLLRSLDLSRLYLTHFGWVDDVQAHLDELESRLLDWAGWINIRFEEGRTVEETVPEFETYVRAQLSGAGLAGEDLVRYEKANPAYMSVAGLMRYWKKRVG